MGACDVVVTLAQDNPPSLLSLPGDDPAAKLLAVLQAFPDYYFCLTTEGVIVDHHAREPDLLYKAPREFLGRRVDEVLPAAAGAAWQAGIARLVQVGEVDPVEYSLPEKDGLHHYEATFARLSQGYVLAVVRDVTVTREATRALREQERLFRRIVETTDEGVWVIDDDGRTTFANEQMERMLGCEPGGMIGRSMYEFMDERLRATAVSNLDRRRRGVREQHDFRFVRADGTTIDTLLSTSPLQDDEGRFVGAVALVADITERARAEHELRRSQERYRSLVEAIDGIVWEATADLRFTFVSAQAERLLGYPVSRWTDEPGFWAEHLHPEDREWCTEYCARATREVRPHSFEYRMIAADGRVVWLRDVVSVISDAAGEPSMLCGVMVDVTDRKVAEAERHRLLVESQEAVRARDEFLSIASHELRTPLTSLQLSVQSVQRAVSGATKRSPEFVRAGVDTSERQVRRLTRLVDQLLDVSRITTGRLDLMRETVDLGEVVQDVLGALRPDLQEAGTRVTVEEDDRVVGRWDRARVEQVITNLVTNAIKYGEGRPISIEVRAVKGEARLVVSDHGIGIPPDRLPHVFDRFERAVSSRHYGGLGLGLYIVRRIVEEHGGHAAVESTQGMGSTFTITLPGLEA